MVRVLALVQSGIKGIQAMTAYTEDEAREKRCCGPEGCGAAPYPPMVGYDMRYCIASACMAWEFEPDFSGGESGYVPPPRPSQPRRGDCSLKRKP